MRTHDDQNGSGSERHLRLVQKGGRMADARLCGRYAAICERIASGAYNDPSVLARVAERIVARRDLDYPTDDN